MFLGNPKIEEKLLEFSIIAISCQLCLVTLLTPLNIQRGEFLYQAGIWNPLTEHHITIDPYTFRSWILDLQRQGGKNLN